MPISISPLASFLNPSVLAFEFHVKNSRNPRKWQIRSSSAAPGIDLKTLEAAIAKLKGKGTEPFFTQETAKDQTFQTFEPTDEPEWDAGDGFETV